MSSSPERAKRGRDNLLEGWCHSEAYQTNTVSAPSSDQPRPRRRTPGGGLRADSELGSAEVARRQESPYVDGQVAFRRPTAASGSVVFTRASEHNGEVTSATVVRLRFATGQPPQVLDVRAPPSPCESGRAADLAPRVW
jgi:hypothetical protein